MTSDQWSASPPSPLALCGRPRHCAAIPGTTASSPALWEPRLTGHRHAVAVQPPVIHQPNPQTGVQEVTKREAPTLLPSKPLLDGYRTRQDARQRQDSLGTTIKYTTLCAMPPYVALRVMRHDCKPSPLSL
jgi:hypothetical protein